MRKYLLPESGKYYKANLHCHSNISDATLSPEELKKLYKGNGYSVLAITDHDILIPHHDLDDDEFIAISGFEAAANEFNSYPSASRKNKCCHLCFLALDRDNDIQPFFNEKYAYIGNCKDYHNQVKYDENTYGYIRDYSIDGINEMIKLGKDAGFFVTYNHPTWSLETYNEYTGYKGMDALEIRNYACEKMGYPSYVPNIYDDMLRANGKLYAVAADDNHNKRNDSFGGYVMIKADELKYEAITDALSKGNFYSSNGPEIYDLYIEDGKIYVTCSDAVMITLNADRRRKGGGMSVVANIGETINSAVFDVIDEEEYIRISVKDKYGRVADTNAYFLKDL